MDGVIILSDNSSEVEILSISSDEEKTVQSKGTGDPVDPLGSSQTSAQTSSKSKEKSDAVAKSASLPKMTCMRETSAQPTSVTKQQQHKHGGDRGGGGYRNKTWSQVRKEKEERRHGPPASKKARCSVETPKGERPNLFSFIQIPDDDEDDFSDDLPDLDQRQKSPEATGLGSPIVVSDDDNGCSRRSLFASLSAPELSKSEHSLKSVASCSSVPNVPTPKDNQSMVKKLLLTKTTKDQMKQVIGSFLKSKTGNDSRPQSPSAFSDVSSGSSGRRSNGSRHFLDAISENNETSCPQSPMSSLSDVSDTSNIDLSDGEREENFTFDAAKSSPDAGECSSSRKLRTVRTVSKGASSSNTQPRILDFYKPFTIVKSSNTPKWSRISYSSQYKLSEGTEDDLAASMSHLHVNTIEAAFEEGEKFLEYGLSLVSDFASRLKPTEHIVKQILDKCLLNSANVSVSYKSFRLLGLLWQKYPESIHLDWELVTKELNNLAMVKGNSLSTEQVINGSLFLQLVVQAFETDLYRRNPYIMVQINRSLAFKHLRVDDSTTKHNLKEIVFWIGSIITSEFKRVAIRNNDDKWSQVSAGYVPKVLPNFQKLLHLGIQVSRNCVEAAKFIGGEMVRIYMYLSDLRQKKLLLQTISSDLLRFKVTQKILEEYCSGTYQCCADFPVSLNQVVQAYFLASPPRSLESLVTPPQSPSDDDEGASAPDHQYSASDCEELTMLIYYNLQGYLHCAQTKDYEPLAQQPMKQQKKDFSFVSKSEMRQLHEAVVEFHVHLLQLTPELNPATHTYLFMMQCFSALH